MFNKFLLTFFTLALLLSVSFAKDRIVNGKVATRGQFPFMASLHNADGHYCGGSIIGPRHILTAAHCFESEDVSSESIRVGSLNAKKDEGVVIQMQKVFIHPEYDAENIVNDVAVIKLKKHIVYNAKKSYPISLSTKNPSKSVEVFVAGWGLTTEGGDASDQLLYTSSPVITATKCKTYDGYEDVDGDHQICAYKKDTDSCQGDSGGPLFTGSETNAVQHGVVSWGIGCARNPGVYGSVAYYRDWIYAQTSYAANVRNPNAYEDDDTFQELCESIEGKYVSDRLLRCKGLNLSKIQNVDFTWEGCDTSVPAKKLCKRIGFFSCVDDVASCTASA